MPKKRSVHFSDDALAALKVIAGERGYTENQAVNVALVNFGKYIQHQNLIMKQLNKLLNTLGLKVTPTGVGDEVQVISSLGVRNDKLGKPQLLEKYSEKVTPDDQ